MGGRDDDADDDHDDDVMVMGGSNACVHNHYLINDSLNHFTILLSVRSRSNVDFSFLSPYLGLHAQS